MADREVEVAGHGHEVARTEHRHERPEDWGWHAEMGGLARGAGFVVAVVLLLMLLTTHERHIEDFYLVGIAVAILGALVWDRRRRKHSWRQ